MIIISKSYSPGMKVYADKEMISTVLRNLISNAIKFTYPNGKIEIAAEKGHDGIKLIVIDNGKGIPTQVLHKLFKP